MKTKNLETNTKIMKLNQDFTGIKNNGDITSKTS